MDIASIVAALDDEIARLEQVKALLASGGRETGNGLPRALALAPTSIVRRKRKPLSPDARARIAAAQKKRWAKQKAAAKSAAK